MSYDYSENILVQESAGNLLRDELQWDVKFAYNTEVLGDNGTFGRRSYKEILLVRYFRAALKKLNPWITEAQILEAQVALEKRLSTASLLQVNEEKYFLIRDGIPVTVKRPDGKTEMKKAAVIDFLHPENNYFLAVKELKIHGDLYRRRTDIVGFVNGLPLLFVELKKNTVDVQNAYDDNYTDYQDTIPHLFYYNAFLILSNGTEAKVGTLGSKYEFFHEWKRLDEKEQGSVALETMLRGICKKENFLDLLENFILYDHSGGNTVKIRHNSVYTTAYLHLSRYAAGLAVGSRVRQGEVIGYVGSTGVSTGPHLDFRVWRSGQPINPLKMESPSEEPIKPENLAALDSVYRFWHKGLDSLSRLNPVSAPQDSVSVQ